MKLILSRATTMVLCGLALLASAGCDRAVISGTAAHGDTRSGSAGAVSTVSPSAVQVLPGLVKSSPAPQLTTKPAGAPGPSSTPTAGYPQYASGTTPAPATVSLASSCVTPGGKQTLSIVSEPNFVVGYDAQYSDSKDGRTYGGMDSNGRVDSKGYYSSTWIVAVTAPVGQVIVWVAVGGSGETAFRQPTFQVKTSC